MNMAHKFSQHVWQNEQKHGSVFIDTGSELAGVTERSPAFRMPEVLLLTRTTLNTSMDKYLHKVWDLITYPFPTFNGAAVEVW